MTELPNEIILMVINLLPRRTRKRMRLVCRTWGALGAEGLIDRVFISPFEVDMKIFDEISRHPIFSKSVKHLIYDSAQFAPQFAPRNVKTKEDYLYALRYGFDSDKLGYMRYNTVICNDFRELSTCIKYSDFVLRTTQPHTAFVNGWEQYCHHAKEQLNIAATSWFDRIDNGLKSLLSVESVTIRNSWDMIYDDGPDDNKRNYSDFSTLWPAKAYANVNKDGRRRVGSPLARSWSPAYLQPRSIEHYNYTNPTGGSSLTVSDGILELSRVLQLLASARKLQCIKEFQVSRDADACGGVSPYAFIDTSDVGTNLTSLLLPYSPEVNIISLPNEIILLVFRHLPQRGRKQLRLVSKTCASVGALVLIDTIYISPYSEDIKVFNTITSHPILSKGVRHLVYDTARFIPALSKDAYYELLGDEFDLKSRYMKVKKIKNTVYDDLSALILSPGTCGHGQTDLRLLAGLARLGHIRSVSFGNSFERIYDVDNTVDRSGETQLYPAREQSVASSDSGEQESSPADHPDIIFTDTLGGRLVLRTNGKRPVGSPLARSWPPYYVNPLNLDLSEYDDWLDLIKGRNHVPHGDIEFCTMLRLLKLTSKLPLVREFDTRRTGGCAGSVPARVFNSNNLGTTQFLDLSKTLTSLDLGLSDGILEHTSHDLDILRSFLQIADSLQSLAIHFLNDIPEDDVLNAHEYSLHKSTELFPHYTHGKFHC
ncbi:MAG: hypothetical protein Q9221_003344 [Calogaya cf. arnoldii]